ncbi:MAG: hypothetical protein J0M13_17140 [Candidatus Accumulibacter sp.]|nr:hypothetical protein [Candidatus Accumulibacter necessarius]
MVFFKAQRPFEFIDIARDTLCMNHDAIIDRWSVPNNRPAGILYVRTYGAVFKTTDLFSAIKSRSPDALIVDDRCLCPPDFSGTLAPHSDAALFSTGYAKYVDIGFGGYGVLRDDMRYAHTGSDYSDEDLDEVTNRYKRTLRTRASFSYRDSDWLDTAIPRESWESYRVRVEQELGVASGIKLVTNSIYASRLPQDLQFPSVFQSWRFNIQVRNKEAALDAIRRGGLFASGHYDSLAGMFGPGRAPLAETLHRYVINLFNDRYCSPEQAEHLLYMLLDCKHLSPGPLFS